MKDSNLNTAELKESIRGIREAYEQLKSIIHAEGSYQFSANQRFWQIYKVDDIQILLAERVAGTGDEEMAWHTHQLSNEWIIPIRGNLEIYFESKDKCDVATNEHPVLIPMGIAHTARPSEDYFAVVILAPPEIAYDATE